MELKKLYKKKSLTATEKEFLLEKARSKNIAVNVKRGCKECWSDLILQLYGLEKSEVLKPNVDVIWRGIRINEATITEELAIEMQRVGLTKYFK